MPSKIVDRKRKSRDGFDVAEDQNKCREYNEQSDSTSSGDDGRFEPIQKAHKGSKKGCVKGNGGHENEVCKLWLGTSQSAYDAALAYDKARLNLPDITTDGSSLTAPTVSGSDTTMSNESEVCEVENRNERFGFGQVKVEDGLNSSQCLKEDVVEVREEMRELNSGDSFGTGQDLKEETVDHEPFVFDEDEEFNVDELLRLVEAITLSVQEKTRRAVDKSSELTHQTEIAQPDANLLGSLSHTEIAEPGVGFGDLIVILPSEQENNGTDSDRSRFQDLDDTQDMEIERGEKCSEFEVRSLSM